MLHRHVSTVAQNGQTKILALEWVFCIHMAPGDHHSFSYTLEFSWLQSAASPLDVTESYMLYL